MKENYSRISNHRVADKYGKPLLGPQGPVSVFKPNIPRDRTILGSENDESFTQTNLEKKVSFPSFNSLSAHYPGSEFSAKEVYELIGGKVYQNHLNNPAAFSNSCALRMSRALNYSGDEIPYHKGKTGSGKDKKWYFYRVKDLKEYLISKYGEPNLSISPTDLNFKKVLESNKGVIIFNVSGWSDASGHVTTWDGKVCGDHCYFPDDLNDSVNLTSVNIWTI